jgi:2-amino-4-hydroxy-6-hydroxymethyldihydropteridine diphosphokinase
MPTAYIGMGANLPSPAGDPEATLAAAAARLGSIGRVAAKSSLYSTEPVGLADQPRFLNAVIALETDLGPQILLRSLLDIEREFGRDRSSAVRNGPRTLDLDILLYGEERVSESGLEIPHPRMGERAFVAVPLVELASRIGAASLPGTLSQLVRTFLTRSPGQNDAVVPVESAVWRDSGPGHAGHPGES